MLRRFCAIAAFSITVLATSAIVHGQAAPQRTSTSQPAVFPADPIPAQRTTVVWISIDGFRHDYLERFKPPTLTRLAAEGAFTKQETPIFPSLTFPNHVAQVTGVGVSGSGVPMNGWYDAATAKSYNFPNDSSLLRAEPIWVTAARQGVRTMCVDWPMSYDETGPYHAAFFDKAYDEKETDEHRLNRIVKVLRDDHDATPYRLILGYMSEVDHAGHQVAQSSPRIEKAVLQADAEVDHFLQDITAWFNDTHRVDDELILLITTDHGMTDIKATVSIDRLIGADLIKDVTIVTSGPVATIHTENVEPDRADKIVAHLRQYPFLTAWKAQDVSADKHFSDPSRIGQVVVMFKPGYAMTRQRLATTLPASSKMSGNHGYDPAGFPDMQGSAVVWRLRHPIGGVDFGQIDNTQWDATVCRLLGIDSPPTADQRLVFK